ncbi:hypothetical protein [Kitasatospora sp. NPDC086791]|uniref:hypothetical protein n=1 Tax=Kitasatospora sp. NPDC086791 TaxID=3155178 RepID=UPI00341C87D0
MRTQPLDLDAIQRRITTAAPAPWDAESTATALGDLAALLARVRELEAELAGMTDLRDRALARQGGLRAENERLAKDRDFWLDVTRDARNLIATAETPEQALDEVRELLNP